MDDPKTPTNDEINVVRDIAGTAADVQQGPTDLQTATQTTPDKPKHPGGAKTKIHKIQLRKVKQLAAKGFTQAEIAHFFDISLTVLKTYKKKEEKFMTAIEEGKKIANSRIERSLYERARGYSHLEEKVFCSEGQIVTHQTRKHYPPETAAISLFLRNRDPKNWLNDQPQIKVDQKTLVQVVIAKDEENV